MSVGRKIKNYRKNLGGFTLIEVLAAISIIVFSIFFMIGMFPLGFKMSVQSGRQTVATYLAQSKIEEFLSQNYIDISTGTTSEISFSSIDEDFAIYDWSSQVNYVNENLQTVSEDSGLKKITVQVFWPNSVSGESSSVILSTLVADY